MVAVLCCLLLVLVWFCLLFYLDYLLSICVCAEFGFVWVCLIYWLAGWLVWLIYCLRRLVWVLFACALRLVVVACVCGLWFLVCCLVYAFGFCLIFMCLAVFVVFYLITFGGLRCLLIVLLFNFQFNFILLFGCFFLGLFVLIVLFDWLLLADYLWCLLFCCFWFVRLVWLGFGFVVSCLRLVFVCVLLLAAFTGGCLWLVTLVLRVCCVLWFAVYLRVVGLHYFAGWCLGGLILVIVWFCFTAFSLVGSAGCWVSRYFGWFG